jgi:hypothetical protein
VWPCFSVVVSVILLGSACTKGPMPISPVVAAALTVPSPPEGCRANYWVSAADCQGPWRDELGSGDDGQWAGDGKGDCILGVPVDGHPPHWGFWVDGGYEGTVRCMAEGCVSPPLHIAADLTASPEVLGKFIGPGILAPMSEAIKTGPHSVEIPVIPQACPGGEYPGRPISDLSPTGQKRAGSSGSP